MHATLRLIVVLAAVSAAATGCGGLGGLDSDGGGGDGDGGGVIEDGRPEFIACEATLAVRGSVADPIAPAGDPADYGCVPFGTWNVEVSLADAGDCAASSVQFATNYQYQVEEDESGFGYVITYLDDPDSERFGAKITTGGSTICNGGFLHLSPDGLSMVELRPFSSDQATIEGTGRFELYNSPQD